MRKILSLLLALVLCVSLFGCAANQEPEHVYAPTEETTPATEATEETTPATEPELPAEDIVILYTNDVHTYIDGVLNYSVIAALKEALQAEYPHVLLLDAGDHIQGTAFGSMDKGETIITLMNAAGYDLATLGNHEFDYGMEGRINACEWAEFPYVSCNFYHETEGVRGENVLPGYVTFELGGTKLAILGITTPETFTKSTPAYFQDENGNYI